MAVRVAISSARERKLRAPSTMVETEDKGTLAEEGDGEDDADDGSDVCKGGGGAVMVVASTDLIRRLACHRSIRRRHAR